jgi:hypothetical protein
MSAIVICTAAFFGEVEVQYLHVKSRKHYRTILEARTDTEFKNSRLREPVLDLSTYSLSTHVPKDGKY